MQCDFQMDEENLEDILGAAHHLQFTSIVNKVPNGLSRCHTKTCLSFFWYDTYF